MLAPKKPAKIKWQLMRTVEDRFVRVPETGSYSSSDLMWDWPFRL